MFKNITYKCIAAFALLVAVQACKSPVPLSQTADTSTPENYPALETKDTVNTANIKWKEFFKDPYLTALIDTALQNNQELNIVLQEISISQNEVRARKGEYLPFVGFKGGAGLEKPARYTRNGAVEATTDIEPGEEMPEPLPDYMAGLYASWEIDIWNKLHNAKKSATMKYLSSVEGKNFVVTNLIAEIANSYYELLALDNQLAIIEQYIEIQKNALSIVKLQKKSAKVNELAVRRFEAQLYKTRSLQYEIKQRITVTENRINFLAGRYPQPVQRSGKDLTSLIPDTMRSGLPSQLLANRPDIRQAELELAAAKLDVKVARANFYPSLEIKAGVGYQAFKPSYLLRTPESLLYSLISDITAPLINRNAIKAAYFTAGSKQMQAIYNYERTILNAYIEVSNQLSLIQNLDKSYSLRKKQVNALTKSITISNNLFKSARADYMEVLLTQREALESKFELIETRKQQMNAMVNIYKALGGGWN